MDISMKKYLVLGGRACAVKVGLLSRFLSLRSSATWLMKMYDPAPPYHPYSPHCYYQTNNNGCYGGPPRGEGICPVEEVQQAFHGSHNCHNRCTNSRNLRTARHGPRSRTEL